MLGLARNDSGRCYQPRGLPEISGDDGAPPPPAAQGHGAKEGVVTIIGTVTTKRA